MVLFGNRKYACLSCIRGHRSSSCEHRDRILLQVRKPGRKSQTEPKSRFALVAKETSPSVAVSKESDYKLVKVPDVKHTDMEKQPGHEEESTLFEDDDVVVTEKYVFVHVGGNMFKRELRPGYKSIASSPRSAATSAQVSPHTPATPRFASSAENFHAVPSEGVPSSLPDASHLLVHNAPHAQHLHSSAYVHHPHQLNAHPIPTNTGHESNRELLPPSGHNLAIMDYHEVTRAKALPPASGTAHLEAYSHSSSRPSEDLALPAVNEPPLVIGPMQFQHDIQGRQANILNELGLSLEEASQIWSGDVTNGEFSFASQCVLPGQCHCGDACECPDCYEHQRLRHRKANRKGFEKQAVQLPAAANTSI